LTARSSDELRRQVNDAEKNLTLDAKLDAVRLSRATARPLPFYQHRADADYEAAFRDSVHVAPGSNIESAAAIVSASPARTALLAALEDWACAISDQKRREWVLNVASGSDPDPEGWLKRIRNPSQWNDRDIVRDLAATVPAAKVPVSTLLIIAERLRQAKLDPQPFLRAVQKEHPADFYANLALGDATMNVDGREAELCYRTALVARPEAAIAYSDVANSLRVQFQFDEALNFHKLALGCDSNSARVKCDLAATDLSAGRFNEAVTACNESLKLDPNDVWSHFYLAGALSALGHVEVAVRHYAITNEQAADVRAVSDAYRSALIQAGRLKDVREMWAVSLRAAPLQDSVATYDQWNGSGYAEFCLFSGDLADYRSARAAMIDRFASTTSVQTMQQVALGCLLLPASQENAADIQRACALAERALAGKKPTSGDYANYVFVKAVADFRRGDFDAAIREANGDGSHTMGPCPKLIVAMALKGEGLKAESDRALADAVVKFDWRVGSADNRELWVYQILLHEALSSLVPDLKSLSDESRKPIDNNERAILIAECQSERLHRLCAQTFVDALAIEPDFIEKRRPNPRFVAACASSALALCHEESSQGGTITFKSRTLTPSEIRALTCQWLSKVLQHQIQFPPLTQSGRAWLGREFATWQRDPGLADLHDSVQIESNGPEFRTQCTALWKSVDRGITRMQPPKPSTRPS
jgi:serine/threonine-protein kinase